MAIELTDALLSSAAGWEVMKRARAYVDQGQVLSSSWAPPVLRGVVQAGEISFAAAMVLKSQIDIENLCTCREARAWGKICAHAVAVGLHWLKAQNPAVAPAERPRPRAQPASSAPVRKAPSLRRDPAGEPAELSVILPPNLEQALARGKVTIVFEASWKGGRVPLNALPKDRSFSFSAADTALLETAENIARGETPAILQIAIPDFAALLPVLADHPRITLGKSSEVTVRSAPRKQRVRCMLEANGEITVGLASPQPFVMVQDWLWQDGSFRPSGLPGNLRDLLRSTIRITRSQVPQFLNQEWPALQAAHTLEANFKPEDFAFEPQNPRFHLELKGGLAHLTARLQCAYGPRIMTLGVTDPHETAWLPDPESPTRYSTRDFAGERAALARLQRHGFTWPDDDGRLQLVGQNAVLNFLAREFPKLEREWQVVLEERLERSAASNLERIEPRFQISSGTQWFDLGVVFASPSGETLPPAEIQRLLLAGQSHARLKNGKYAMLDTGAVEELQEVLLDCHPEQHREGYRIQNNQSGFLEATLRRHPAWRVEAPAAWRERAARQSGEVALECPPLGNLEAILRPYQKRAVGWFNFLRANGFGGILADEMGLGKTLQTLAFLRFLRQTQPGLAPMLVVCPTSLVFNWAAEALKFTPELRVLPLHGPDRHARFAEVPQAGLVLTSYALIRRDAERYRDLEFDTVILDEAQHIKNRQTQNAQAVKSVKARHRIVLSGTPLENSVLDLWSIFDFLMPGYLGSAKDFRERYEIPITREKNPEAQARLARRLRPFMLRRLKKEVAADLPAKLEQVSFCELNEEQRAIYQQLIEASRKEILAAAGEQAQAKSRMMVLTALLRLRQVCCDLRLLNLEGAAPGNPSGKLELFDELIEEVMDGGHRVLVFSQFVSMLTILKEKLAAAGVEFCYLDGSTADRGAVVQRFQTNPAIPVFLISLKAGGVGLNLTGADTVIHFDPWWNPAVEDQATDRAHRLGQTKVVTSYKLITRDTVEEKILALQNRKRELLQAAIGGEEEFVASLGWDELQELFL